MRPWEYAATGILWVGGVSLRLLGPQPAARHWALPGEDAFIDAVALEGTSRDVAAVVSDASFYGLLAYRVLDSSLTPGLKHGAWDVSQQLLFIDLEALGFTAAVFWIAQAAVGRERPSYDSCPGEAPPGRSCDGDDNERYRSFIAGHLAMSTAAASLTCLHHARLPLYGSGLAGDLACATTIAAAAASGVTRALTENHYPSDLVLGAGLGIVGGYLVPKALHYGFGSDDRDLPSPHAKRRRAPTISATILPKISDRGGGLSLVGRF